VLSYLVLFGLVFATIGGETKMAGVNRQLQLKSRPAGLIEPNTFAVESVPIPEMLDG
jgi:hypothetical protein